MTSAAQQYSRTHRTSGFLAGFLAAPVVLLLAGCGAQYRPVVSAINPVGPAGQPTKFAVAISSPTPTLPGLVTFVDFSGDTVLSTPSILASPSYFAVDPSGGTGYVINAGGQFNSFPLGNPSSLLTSDIQQTTLPAASNPLSITSIALAGQQETVFIPEAATSRVTVLLSGTNALETEVAVGANPVYVLGAPSTPRVYAISQGSTAGGNGQIAALEPVGTSSLSVSTTIPVGVRPVYGVMSLDTRRAFVLNQGSGTVSVVNVSTNALDTTTPTFTIPAITIPGGTTAPNPVWADLSFANTELVVLNKGDGVNPGTLSIFSIPLCTNSSLPTNPNCNTTNPVDAVGFGQLVATVPVGVNPAMVSVLSDGSRAYVANSGSATVAGSVTVVNLISGSVVTTIPGVADTTNSASAGVFGHPATISATYGTPTGKVYVTSPDSRYVTILYTDTDSVRQHIPLQGLGVRVLVTAQ